MRSLRAISERDLGSIMESEISFRWPLVLTDPDGQTSVAPEYDVDGNITNTPLFSITGDISALIDPDTGQSVSGRLATAAIRISSLRTAGFGLPKGISDKTRKPWIVEVTDIEGIAHTFKVVEGNPDRTAGIVNLTLELYKI